LDGTHWQLIAANFPESYFSTAQSADHAKNLLLEKAFGVIEQMSTFQNVGISVIDRF
jgi:hypothetical protein